MNKNLKGSDSPVILTQRLTLKHSSAINGGKSDNKYISNIIFIRYCYTYRVIMNQSSKNI